MSWWSAEAEQERIKTVLTKTVSFFVFGLILVIVLGQWDVPEPETSDLDIKRPNVLPKENAYTYFASATNPFYWPTNSSLVKDYLNGTNIDKRTIEEIINKNAEAIKSINKGLECKIYLTPETEITGFDDFPLPYIGAWIKIGRIMALQTQYNRLAGKYEEATDVCISMLRFANMIQDNAEHLISYLVGTAMLDIGLTQARNLARDKGVQEEDMTKLFKVLSEIGPFDKGLVRATKTEYKITAKYIENIKEGRFEEKASNDIKMKHMPWLIFQPNKTKQNLADFYRSVIKNSSLYYSEMDFSQFEKLELREDKRRIMPYPVNAMGKTLCQTMLPHFEIILARRCKADCSLIATRLLVALSAYEKKNHELPDSLDDLVPDFLSEVPVDPYDGKPIRYSKEKGIIYSVGRDLEDSGGSIELRPDAGKYHKRLKWHAKDLVFGIRKEIKPEKEKKSPLR